MMRKSWKRALAMAAALILGISAFEVAANFVPEPDIIQVSDPSAWRGDAQAMDVVGREMTLKFVPGNVKSAAVYTGAVLYNETVEFTARFTVGGGGWSGFFLRSNMPDYYLWDMNEHYAFLVRPGQIEVLREHANDEGSNEGITGTIDFDLCDGADHVIRVGAQNYNEKTYLTLSIDGTEVYSAVDRAPLTLDSGNLSFNSYGEGSTVTVTAMGDNEFWDNNPIDMIQPEGQWTAMNPDNWFMNQYQGSIGSLKGIADGRLSIKDGVATYTGNGSITSVNKIDARQFSFQASVRSATNLQSSYADFMVIKASRTSLGNDTGHSLRLYPGGRLQLIRCLNGNAQVFPGFETGLDFTQPHKFTVKIESTGSLSSMISIWVDDQEKAYRYQDNKYGPNLRAVSYFGVYNSDFSVTSTVSDLQFVGSETYVVDDSPVSQVYWPDYLVEKDGRKLIHWVYNTSYELYDGVSITDMSGKEVGYVSYPDNYLELPADHKYTKLYVTAHRVDGKEASKQLIDLQDDRSKYYTDEQERIIVRPADETHAYAGFQTVSGKEFVMNGFNYIELRYGDHSTFEPAIDGVNTADYDPLQAETSFKYLAMHGYNTVRVFIVAGTRREGNAGLSGPSSDVNGLYIPYMENFYDFLERAQKYGVYVIANFSENEMISSNYYRKMAAGNTMQGLLFSEQGMAAKADYVKLFAQYIKERSLEEHGSDKVLNALLAIQAQNEFAFYSTQQPFSMTSGTYEYFDGTKYDMSNMQERRALAMHAAQKYYQAIYDAVKEVDPQLMLCEGTFTLAAVGKDISNPEVYGIHPNAGQADNRFPLTTEEYLELPLDFLDVHIYGNEDNPNQNVADVFMKEQMDLFCCNTERALELRKSKPLILGEYGDYDHKKTEKEYQYIVQLLDAAVDNGMAGGLYWELLSLGGAADETEGKHFDRIVENLERFAILQ